MASLRGVRLLERRISKLASSLKKHFRTNIGVYLFAIFLVMLAMYKRADKVTALLRALIARRMLANRGTVLPELSLSNTVLLGTLQNLGVKVRGVTSLSSEHG